MRCSNCKAEYDITEKYCPYCGENNENFKDSHKANPKYQENKNESQNYANQNYNLENNGSSYERKEQAEAGWVILSFLFPFVGFILIFAFKNTKPATSKACVTATIIGFILNVIFGLSY